MATTSLFLPYGSKQDVCSHVFFNSILGLQSISWDVAHNASHPCRLDPTMELIKYSFVLYLQHDRHDVKCKPSIGVYILGNKKGIFVLTIIDNMIDVTESQPA